MMMPTRISFSLFFFIILSESNFLANAQNTTIPVNVGVILDFDAWSGKMGLGLKFGAIVICKAIIIRKSSV